MLKRVHIKIYRSCRNVEIADMGPVLALVGRNGAGKTNILRAILRTARLRPQQRWLQAPSFHLLVWG